MDELARKIVAEKENVEIAIDQLNQARKRSEKTVVELAAMGAFLHNIYNGIENILKQVIKAQGRQLPSTKTWHKDLLALSIKHGIISNDLADDLYPYLTFRHFFVHSYAFMLEEAHLTDLIEDIHDVWSKFIEEIDCFCSD